MSKRPVSWNCGKTEGKAEHGFLLAEALISCALLFVGLLAFYEAFFQMGLALRRQDDERQMAACLQEKFLQTSLQFKTDSSTCPTEADWNVEAVSNQGSYQNVLHRLTWQKKDHLYEETMELLQPAG